METRKAGCKWVMVDALTVGHRLCFGRKVSSVVSPSSVGLEGGDFGASSVATKSAHVMGPLDASDVAVLVIGSDSAVHALLLPVLAPRTVVLVLRMLVLLASGATLHSLSLVVPRCLGVGQRSFATRRCMQQRRQDPLQGVARSSVATPVWTLSFSLKLH
jgi:hypothetical protein